MHWGSRAFVFVVFASLAASFWATTVHLYLEFADEPWKITLLGENSFLSETWFKLLSHYSDLFIFFPLFGTVALIAFYTPACAFVDMYWNLKRQHEHGDPIPWSRLRFTFWFVFAALVSFGISEWMHSGQERSIWQLAPEVVKNDKGSGCTEKFCTRVSFVDGLDNIRRLSRERGRLTDLARVCQDPFIQPPHPFQEPRKRYCPASTNFKTGGDLKDRWQSDQRCCEAQQAFDKAVRTAHDNVANRSETDALQSTLWPLNIFFLVILLAISILLALRRGRIARVYSDYSGAIDCGVIVGVVAVAFLVVMHRGFIEVTELLHGVKETASFHRAPNTFLYIFAVWALIILFSFVHPANKQAELVSRLIGVAFSVLFVFQADTITNNGVRHLGAGAGEFSVLGMLLAPFVLLLLLYFLPRFRLTGGGEVEGQTDAAEGEQSTSADRLNRA